MNRIISRNKSYVVQDKKTNQGGDNIGRIVIMEFKTQDSTAFDDMLAFVKQHPDFEKLEISYEPTLSLSGLEINLSRRRVINNGQEIELTVKEYDILCLLAANKGRVLTYEQIYDKVWGEISAGNEKDTVGFYIRNLRKKLCDAKYQIIYDTMQKNDNLLNVAAMCEIAGVSRSGYYHYLSTENQRMEREERDRQDFLLILKAYQYRGYHKGARSIYMRLLHMEPPIVMNIKKIRRLMKKYNLQCPIRKANPYRRMAKAMATAYTAPNIVNREFEEHGPRKILLTDITYIINAKAPWCYMSTIIDACTKELLSWVLSESLEIDFVLETVKQLIEKHGTDLSTETLIHSDQGSHYTSIKFIQLLKDNELRQSMSRRANCWDNAPQESFFGHMKDELDLSECYSYEEILNAVRDWTEYYNTERYQWDLARLSPVEYYQYLTTGIYPLLNPKAKGENNQSEASL
ncbi:IS3 family transposase [Coprococcus hominis (ex Arizal et al. 2022)]